MPIQGRWNFNRWIKLSSALSLSLCLACGPASDSSRAEAPSCNNNSKTNSASPSVDLEKLTAQDGVTSLLVKIPNLQKNFESFRSDLVQAHGPYAASLGKMRMMEVAKDVLSVEIPKGSPALDILNDKWNSRQIEFIEPDHETFAIDPKDEVADEATNLSSSITAANPFPPVSNPAVDNPLDGKEIIVAVIDSGVDYSHRDLNPYIWRNTKEIPRNGIDDDRNGYVDDSIGWDFANNDNNPMADDTRSYHGTHVAGIVKQAAQMAKIGVKIKIMALKYLSASGTGKTSNAIRAIDYALHQGAVVLNNSWGSLSYSSALAEAIERVRQAHALFVAAAGNGDSHGRGLNIDRTPFYPAAYDHDNIISVAASDCYNHLTGWSNFGFHRVDLAAPGLQIRSTRNGNTYAVLSGTSMATPYVSGVAAMLWSARPQLSYSQVRRSLMTSVDRFPSFQDKVVSSGQINTLNAIRTAVALSANSAEPPPENALPSCP